jgi:hypothetical protein
MVAEAARFGEAVWNHRVAGPASRLTPTIESQPRLAMDDDDLRRACRYSTSVRTSPPPQLAPARRARHLRRDAGEERAGHHAAMSRKVL